MASDAASFLAPGRQIAGYRVEAVAGRGGMGVVYRATQLALDRTVALKIVAPELAGDEDFRERFKRESRIAASIEHPNVIPVHEAGEADGVLFISMRYVEGTDLRELLALRGPLEPERTVRIVGQVAEALDAAHARGLVHRDVKPANVLIGDRGGMEHVYLTDFGLSKQSSSQSGLTKTGQWVGTLDYIAPEQIEGRPVDARTDVYALGCVLYQALTGEVPFVRDSEVSKLWAHISEPPPAPSHRRPGVPPALDAVVVRAMAKDPAQRHRTAGELAAEARVALAGAAGGPSPSSGASTTPGAPRPAAQQPAPPPPVPHWPAPTPAAPAPVRAEKPPYGRRGLALAMDWVIIEAISFLIALPLDSISSDLAVLTWFFLAPPIVAFLYVLPLMRRRGVHAGQTLGKQAVGLRVVAADGTTLPPTGRVVLREVVLKFGLLGVPSFFLVGIPILLNYLWPRWEQDGRALHDLAARTRVVSEA